MVFSIFLKIKYYSSAVRKRACWLVEDVDDVLVFSVRSTQTTKLVRGSGMSCPSVVVSACVGGEQVCVRAPARSPRREATEITHAPARLLTDRRGGGHTRPSSWELTTAIATRYTKEIARWRAWSECPLIYNLCTRPNLDQSIGLIYKLMTKQKIWNLHKATYFVQTKPHIFLYNKESNELEKLKWAWG